MQQLIQELHECRREKAEWEGRALTLQLQLAAATNYAGELEGQVQLLEARQRAKRTQDSRDAEASGARVTELLQQLAKCQKEAERRRSSGGSAAEPQPQPQQQLQPAAGGAEGGTGGGGGGGTEEPAAGGWAPGEAGSSVTC